MWLLLKYSVWTFVISELGTLSMTEILLPTRLNLRPVTSNAVGEDCRRLHTVDLLLSATLDLELLLLFCSVILLHSLLLTSEVEFNDDIISVNIKGLQIPSLDNTATSVRFQRDHEVPCLSGIASFPNAIMYSPSRHIIMNHDSSSSKFKGFFNIFKIYFSKQCFRKR